MVVVTVLSDAVLASALVARWATSQDRVDAGLGRGAAASLRARAALRALLAQHTGQTEWWIQRTKQGKPFVVGPSGFPGPAVSLSHTGDIVAVAMAQTGALGLDVERHRERNFAALAAQAFGPRERAQVAVGGKGAFYRIWTLREAVAKATGDGLALAANRRDLVADSTTGRIGYGGRVWRVAHVRIEPACSLAVAHADMTEGSWALRWVELGAAA